MVAKRRLSVNDLIRGELKQTLGRTDLSAADRRRLDGHFTAIREIETKLQGALAPEAVARVKDVAAGAKYNQAAYVDVTRTVQLELMAFAAASRLLEGGGAEDRAAAPTTTATRSRASRCTRSITSRTGSNRAAPAVRPSPPPSSSTTWSTGSTCASSSGSSSTWPAGRRREGPLHRPGLRRLHQPVRRRDPRLQQPALDHRRPGARLLQDRALPGGERRRGTLNQMHNTCLGAVGVTKPDGSPVDDFGAAEALKGRLMNLVAV